jgi:enolase
MPSPQIKISGGGAHACRRTDIQGFLVMPTGAETFDQALCMVADVYRAAGDEMARRGSRYGVADEGAGGPTSTQTNRCCRCSLRRSRRPASATAKS